jgi:pimeloyl-ACP methyl ester carboxylesterase
LQHCDFRVILGPIPIFGKLSIAEFRRFLTTFIGLLRDLDVAEDAMRHERQLGSPVFKLCKIQRGDYDWSTGDAAIMAPLMLVLADADAVRPDHVTEFFGLLDGGKRDAGLDGSGRPQTRLAVVPGTTHYNILSSPVFPAIIESYLKEESVIPRFFE